MGARLLHAVAAIAAAFVGFIASIQPGDAHTSGAEFTYLNMFQPKAVGDGHIDTGDFINAKPLSIDYDSKKKPRKHRLHGTVKKAERVQAPDSASRLQIPFLSEYDVVEKGDDEPPATMHRRRLRSEPAIDDEDDEGSEKERKNEERSSDGEPQEKENTGRGSPEGSSSESGAAPIIFEGVGGKKDGEDIKRVSFMLMRLLKQYKLESMVDVPCRAHASWMHKFLAEVDREIPNFKYFCVDSSKEILQAVKARVKGKANAKFILRLFWEEKLPRADVVFSWNGLDKMKRGNVAKLFRNIAVSDRHKFLIVGNHMKGSKVLSKKAKELNVRSEPFRLQKPMRVISKLSVDPVRKQMYFYKTKEMKENWDDIP